MRIAVFGSSGKVGTEVVRQALDRGYTVVAYARNPRKVDITHPRLTVVPGELRDRRALTTAIQGVDIVVSALGPVGSVRDTALSEGAGNMLSVMEGCGVSRLILLSTISSPDPHDRKELRSRLIVGAVKRSYPGSYAEIVRIGQLVRASDIDWTLVRVTLLNDKPLSKKVRAGYLGHKAVGSAISRADLAWFMLEQAESSEWSRKAPAVSN